MSETTTEKKTPLETYWDQPVSKLATIEPARDPKPLTDALAERHRLYSLGLMAITHHYWNGLKKGRDGTYPLNPKPATAGGKHLLDDYRGHNIAGFAVDKLGYIIDFEFNHNRLMNSSAEHAEARLVRRIFSLNQIHDSWDVRSSSNPAASDYNTFEEVTVYTTLESCSQCSGIMALARVREVVYLQTDPGMYRIGNILRNLTRGTGLESPYPRPATDFGFGYLTELDLAYKAFAATVGQTPFFIPRSGTPDTSDSLTSFLCTDAAYQIYGSAAAELNSLATELAANRMPLAHPDAHPVDRAGSPVPKGLTNLKALKEILSFVRHAKEKGRRGTPHR